MLTGNKNYLSRCMSLIFFLTGGKVYPFLCLLPESEYIEIIINHLCRTVNGGDFTSAVSRQLGEEVFARLLISIYIIGSSFFLLPTPIPSKVNVPSVFLDFRRKLPPSPVDD